MVDPVPELLGAERLFAELGHGCRQRIARQADEIALLVEGVPHGPRGRGEDGGMLAHGALDRPSGERKPADSGADSAGPAADSDRQSVVEGTSGAVRVNLGGRRIIKKKKKK